MYCTFLDVVRVMFRVLEMYIRSTARVRVRFRFMVRVRLDGYAYNQGWGLRICVKLTAYDENRGT